MAIDHLICPNCNAEIDAKVSAAGFRSAREQYEVIDLTTTAGPHYAVADSRGATTAHFHGPDAICHANDHAKFLNWRKMVVI